MKPSRYRRGALAGVAAAALGLGFTTAASAATPCEKLTGLTITQVAITSAVSVPAGPFAAPGSAPIQTPAFCRVQGAAHPTPDSDIRFEVWLPVAAAWNGKYQGVGTGGYQGSISYSALAEGLKRGYAVSSTDTGHVGDDLAFGSGHPEKVRDWAYRAMHVTAQTAKVVVRNGLGRQPDYSYFVGCSTGGHQALSEAQRYPEDYDGIVAGDPAYDRVHQTAAYLWLWRQTHDAAGVPLLSLANLKLLTTSAVRQCDELDRVKDGIINDPRACHFDPASIRCQGKADAACLTPVQVAAAKAVYAGLRNPRTGELLFPGWTPGSEAFGDSPGQGWGAYLIQPKQPMRGEVYKYFLFEDPSWDFTTFDFDKDVAYSDQKIGYMAAVDHDLRLFRDRGGKLIMYTGWADPVAAPEDIIKYYEGVTQELGGLDKVQSFYRFFMAPGMGHCTGGPGPSSFDMVTALEQWVEHGKAPTTVIASHLTGDKADRTRPLCPYPLVSRWTGSGSTDEAKNFTCAVPER